MQLYYTEKGKVSMKVKTFLLSLLISNLFQIIVHAQKPELVLPIGHTGYVNSAVFSPDGKYILTASYDKTAKIWETSTGKVIHSLEGHTGEIQLAVFSPSGKYIATASKDGKAKIWETLSGRLLFNLVGHEHFCNTVEFSPDGKYLVSAGNDATAKIYDVTDGNVLMTLKNDHYCWVNSATFSPDEKLILTANNDSTAKLWDASSGKLLFSLQGHKSDWITHASFSPNGKYFITTGARDERVNVWEVSSGNIVKTIDANSDFLSSAIYSPDGKKVITTSIDKVPEVWDVSNGNLLYQLNVEITKHVKIGSMVFVAPSVFSPNGKCIISASFDGVVNKWEAESGKLIGRMDGHIGFVTSISISQDGRYIVTGSTDNTVKLWDLETGILLHTLTGYADEVNSAAYNSDGEKFVTASDDSTATLWDAKTGRPIHILNGHNDRVNTAEFSPDNKYIATSSWDNTAKIWESVSGKLIHTLEGHRWTITSAAFSPDGKYIATASYDSTSKIWDIKTGKLLHTLIGHTDWIYSAKFSPDGKRLATGSKDNKLKVWDISNGEPIKTFEGPKSWISNLDDSLNIKHKYQLDAITSLSFSADGEYLALGGMMGTCEIRKESSGEILKTLEMHRGLFVTTNFSPDGKYLVTGNQNNTAKIWSTNTGELLHTLQGHTHWVNSAAFSPEGRLAITASSDARIKIWDVESGKELITVIKLGKDDWVHLTADGHFDASPNAMKLLYYVVDSETIDLEQLKERYYEPGLYSKVMGYNKEPIRNVKGFGKVELFPEIKLKPFSSEDSLLQITLRNRGGGIGKVAVFINNNEITGDARGQQENPQSEEMNININIAGSPSLLPGKENIITVKAYNQEGYLSSRGVEVIYTAPQSREIEPPNLYGLIVGISDYEGTNDLMFAAKDAKDFTNALSIAAKRLFGKDKVHIQLIEDSTLTTLPTKNNIVRVLESLQKIKTEDILVIYLSGHGVNGKGQDGDFYYMTREARGGDLTDPEIKNLTSLSSTEITELIMKIPALKKVLILDVCSAGRFVEQLSMNKDIPSSQTRAIDRMKDKTGMIILAGCAADAVSYEASRYGQGLLTYSLLMGMKGAALRENEFVDVQNIFSFCSDEVPKLAENIGGIQRPIISIPYGGQSFDIGQLTEEDKEKIYLVSSKPVFLQSTFQDEEKIRDVLGLSKKVNKAMRDLTARGSHAPMVYVDATEYPDAFSLTGRYKVENSRVKVKVFIFKDASEIGRFSLEDWVSNLNILVNNIIARTENSIK